MIKFVLKRICMIPLMLLLITAIIFFLVNSVDVNPALTMLGAEASSEAIAQLNDELGYNDPVIVRYFSYLIDLLRGDMGTSYYTRTSVFDEVMNRLPNTLMLSLCSVAIAILFGLPLGILTSVKQYSVADHTLTILAMFIAAAPNFWLALMLMLAFSLKLGWLPSSGLNAGWKSWVLPIATASIPYIASFMRYVRSSMLESIRQDYVTTARAKGCPEKTIIVHHILRNSLMPIITVSGLTVGTLMASTVVVENVFSISGIGSLILNAVKQKDVPMVMGAMLIFGFLFAIITVVIDVLYGFADPRVKAMYVSKREHKRKKKTSDPAAV